MERAGERREQCERGEEASKEREVGSTENRESDTAT